MKEYVLDSYAILAYLESEPGSDRIQELFEEAAESGCKLSMCSVNLGEVIYIVERERGLSQAQETLARIAELPIEILDADRVLTLAAAHIKAQCPIAHADCFSAALTVMKKATLVTGDPEFHKVTGVSAIEIEWLADKG